MKHIISLSFIGLFYCFYSYSQSNKKVSYISGHLELDSIWNREIYLSHIPSFSKMYTMSKSMIIAESQIDESGHFYFNIDYLPKEDNLYRLHISAKF